MRVFSRTHLCNKYYFVLRSRISPGCSFTFTNLKPGLMLPSNEYGVSNTVLSEVDALRWFSSSTLSCLPSATTLKPSPVSATVKSFDSIVVTLRYILQAEDCNGITLSTFTFTRTDIISCPFSFSPPARPRHGWPWQILQRLGWWLRLRTSILPRRAETRLRSQRCLSRLTWQETEKRAERRDHFSVLKRCQHRALSRFPCFIGFTKKLVEHLIYEYFSSSEDGCHKLVSGLVQQQE